MNLAFRNWTPSSTRKKIFVPFLLFWKPETRSSISIITQETDNFRLTQDLDLEFLKHLKASETNTLWTQSPEARVSRICLFGLVSYFLRHRCLHVARLDCSSPIAGHDLFNSPSPQRWGVLWEPVKCLSNPPMHERQWVLCIAILRMVGFIWVLRCKIGCCFCFELILLLSKNSILSCMIACWWLIKKSAHY